MKFCHAVSTDSLSVEFESDDVLLKGNLIIPEAVNSKVPAIIFLVGSGGNSSYSTDYKRFLDFFLLRPFEGEDVAFLFFDKRGVGESEGVWYKTDFELRAKDAANAAKFLRSVPQVNQEKIYVVGHSQGGWIVQICLAKYPEYFAGGVSMAGPTFDVKTQLINDYQSSFICNAGMEPEEALRKAKRRVNRDLTVISLFPMQQEWKQLKIIRKFDPAKYLLTIKKPLLLLFAENDRLVNPEWSLQKLDSIFPTGHPDHFSIYVAKGENHSFQTSPLCYTGAWTDLNYSETTREEMKDWLGREFQSCK
ncbi:alpha/beta hydrolase family protein [Pleomorphovibrio marinus]|uniref:alpha/beta hydrolase family protein n=1 Tax=Pleomorphovibrio marinus TaxID=2164132 RepID=UPI001E445F4B|nr:alpha/beta fold hydrolase [Pleomorphovibrio marinus]